MTLSAIEGYTKRFAAWLATGLLLSCWGCASGLQETSQRTQDQDVIQPSPGAPVPMAPSAAPPMLPLAPRPLADPVTARLVARAQKHAAEGQWDLAQTALDRAYRIAPRDPVITATKARMLFSQKNYAEAESWAQRTLLLLGPDQYLQRADAWEIIAASRREMGRIDDANKASEKRDEILRRWPSDGRK